LLEQDILIDDGGAGAVKVGRIRARRQQQL
jgi:hypothetical protein